MSEASDLLATLRDISEPPAPDGVSPALVFANLFLVLLVSGLFLHQRHRRRNAWRRSALASIRAARHEQPEILQMTLATVLRRVMRHRYGNRTDALHGDSWLTQLDATFGGEWFRHGDGQAFGEPLYTRDAAVRADPRQLATELTRRLQRLPHPRPAEGSSPPRSNTAASSDDVDASPGVSGR